MEANEPVYSTYSVLIFNIKFNPRLHRMMYDAIIPLLSKSWLRFLTRTGTENSKITVSAITTTGQANIAPNPIRFMSPILIAIPRRATITKIESIRRKKLTLPILVSFLSEKYRSLVPNLSASAIP